MMGKGAWVMFWLMKSSNVLGDGGRGKSNVLGNRGRGGGNVLGDGKR